MMEVSKFNQKILKKFNVISKVGSGSFRQVFKAQHIRSKKIFAIKYESSLVQPPQLDTEIRIMKVMAGSEGFPQVHLVLNEVEGIYAVMDFLPNSLQNLLEICGGTFSLKTVLMVADQLLLRLQYFHQRSYIHKDIKPENVMIGSGHKKNIIYLIDYGLSSQYCDPFTKIHIPFREGKNLVGTIRYASVNVHDGKEYSRRDDLESLAYILIYLLKGSLPWQSMKTTKRMPLNAIVCYKKTSIPAEEICKGIPEEFMVFLNKVRALEFNETPPYAEYREMFRNLFIREGFVYDYVYDWAGKEEEVVVKKSTKKSSISSIDDNDEKMQKHQIKKVKSDEFGHHHHHHHKISPFLRTATPLQHSALSIFSFL